MASRKATVASLPALLLIGALLLLVMAGPGAVSKEDAASGQFPPASLDRAPPEPSSSLKNSRGIRAGSPVVSTSLDDGALLPSAPTTMGSAAVPPEAPAPQPHPPPEDCEKKLYLFILIILFLCCIFNQQ